MDERRLAFAAALAATTLWGLAPVLYRALNDVPAGEVLAHRVVWGMLFIVGFSLATGRGGRLREAMRMRPVLLSAALITFNWGLFIWAIHENHAVEASLGYFIFPIFSVLLGIAVFRERLAASQWLAVCCAAAAVALLAFGLGTPPWIALSLSLSFAVYGTVKKRWPVGPIVSVAAECLWTGPPMALWIGWQHLSGGGAFGVDLWTSFLLVLSGIFTAVPLILFAEAARILPLSTVGIMFYINPTLQFLIAVLVFREPFTTWHAAAFALIWCGIALFTRAEMRREGVA